jgi:hypothetical protein
MSFLDRRFILGLATGCVLGAGAAGISTHFMDLNALFRPKDPCSDVPAFLLDAQTRQTLEVLQYTGRHELRANICGKLLEAARKLQR